MDWQIDRKWSCAAVGSGEARIAWKRKNVVKMCVSCLWTRLGATSLANPPRFEPNRSDRSRFDPISIIFATVWLDFRLVFNRKCTCKCRFKCKFKWKSKCKWICKCTCSWPWKWKCKCKFKCNDIIQSTKKHQKSSKNPQKKNVKTNQ